MKTLYNFRIPYTPYSFRVRIKIRVSVRLGIRVKVRIRVRDQE